jgi:hypothetical protein
LLHKIRQRRKEKIIKQEMLDNIPTFLRELEEKIKEFKPARHYKAESFYQTELV